MKNPATTLACVRLTRTSLETLDVLDCGSPLPLSAGPRELTDWVGPSPVAKVCLAAMLALLAAGCASAPRVHTQPKPGTDFSRYKTFALLPLAAQAPAADPGLILRLAEPARNAVVESMTAKGLREAGQAEADCAVNLRGSSLPKVEVKDYGYTTYGYTRVWGRPVPVRVGEREVRTYQENTLAVEIFDNRSKEMVWVGWTKGESRGQVQADKLQQAIRRVLAEFPPGPNK